MKRIGIALTLFASLCMASMQIMQPFAAYAEEVLVQDASTEDTSASRDENETYVSGATEDVSSSDAAAEATDGAEAEASDEVSVVEEPSAAEEAVGDAGYAVDEEPATTKASLDLIEYVYVDHQIVSVGENQNFAIGFKDSTTKVSFARIELTDQNGTVHSFDMTDTSDAALLFTFSFDSDEFALRYTLGTLYYTLEGSSEECYIDFTEDETAEYAFDVVTAETADALEGASDEEGVSAIVIDEDGSLAAADSVEEAIEMADSEGVAESEEEETGISPLSSSNTASTREDYLIVAIDPGHGGSDSGAVANGLKERDINWSIAGYFKTELETYTGVTGYLTTSGEEPGLQTRVQRAANVGADVFVSVHINSASAAAKGFEIYVPNNSSYNSSAHTVGTALATKIEAQLKSLGLYDRGVKTRSNNEDTDPTGAKSDYYGVIRMARNAGIPGLIVEHAFITNSSDASKLADDSFRKKLGVADATGVAQQYNLGKDSTAKASASVAVKSHIAKLGWENTVYDNKISGSVGKSLDLQAFQITALNGVKSSGGIQYRANVDGSWQTWKSDGAMAGTTGQSKAVQAIQVQLTGNASTKYDVYYRVHVAHIGWLDWTKNGASAGTSGYGYGIQAIEVAVVAKGAAAPGNTGVAYKEKGNVQPSVSIRAHVQTYGWQNWTTGTAGTTNEAKRIEAMQLKLNDYSGTGTIQINSHVQSIGWQGWKSAGETSGTTNQAKRIEAIKIRLTGDLAEKYDVYYRVHSQTYGWLGWAKNGDPAGTAGYSKRAEAIEVKLVAKGGSAPGSTGNAYVAPLIEYKAHCQSVGWQSYVYDGTVAGTTGQGLRMEALQVNLGAKAGDGGVQVRAHVANEGWQSYTTGVAGTTGKAHAIEAVQIKLTGDAANNYDIYYRVHSASFGWLGWAKNGDSAGSQGYGKAVQAIQIVLVKKGGDAPGSTGDAFRNKDAAASDSTAEVVNDQKIMGTSTVTVSQMVKRYNKNATFPSSTYSDKGASTIEEFCTIIKEEAEAEGVRADVVFAQAMLETAWLKFGGQVKAEQCNFAGLGATDGGASGASFDTVRLGIRAQVQHLKAYASTESLKNDCVDPRFKLVKRGSATTVCALAGKWASDKTYGTKIITIMESL